MMQISTIKTAQQFNVGVYCRLSVDDGNASADSVSIQNQKELLTKYVLEHGWNITQYYIDDGFSGTNFDRPGFKEMLHDIEDKRINLVITKDLSRLGRDYLKTGFYIDTYFPDRDVRYIAVSDNIDTFEHEDDFVPFKNIINEMYAKDVSKKIRFTLQNQMKTGKDNKTAFPLYGYMFDEKGARLPDPTTAPVVQLIYKMFLSGESYASIARYLRKKEIIIPMYYNYQKYGIGANSDGKFFVRDFYDWSRNTVRNILINDEYTGTFRRGKTASRFKSKKKVVVAKDAQYVFEDRYPAIISKKDFELAQEQVGIFKREFANNGGINRYSGMIFCGICGKPMRHKKDVRVNRRDFIRLTCRTPKCGDSRGIIQYEDLDKLLRKEIMALKSHVLEHKKEFLDMAQDAAKGSLKTSEYQIMQNQKNLYEENLSKVERYIKKAYEQKIDGLLLEDTYISMIGKYNAEKDSLMAKIKDLEYRMNEEKDIVPDYYNDALDFVRALESINNINCLERVNLNLLISKIYVTNDGNLKKKPEKRNKEVTIVYRRVDALIRSFLDDK